MKDRIEHIIEQYVSQGRQQRDLLEDIRAKGYRYYRGDQLGNERKGFSQHISHDVFDAVESTKARLLSTFAGTRNIVEFKPRDADDIESAELRNAYLTNIFWEQNNGYKLLHDGIHNGLVAVTSAYRWFWDEKYEMESQPFQGDAVTLQAAMLQLVQQGWEFVAQGGDENNIVGEFVRQRNVSKISIVTIPPERVIYDVNAETMENAAFMGEEARYQGSELVEMGVDPQLLKTLSEDRWRNVQSESARDGRYTEYSQDAITPENTEYLVIDGWIKLDLDGTGIATLYKFLSDDKGQLLLPLKKASQIQMVVGSLIPIPHKLEGLSQAGLLFDVQHSASMVKRQMIDHLARVNSGRMAADLGMVRNPRDLVENRIGSVVDIDMSQGQPIMPLPQDSLSPTTAQTLETLMQEKEQRAGVSRLSQGLNSDAISHQNSASMIDQMTTLSTARVMMMARHFAELILKPLLNGVYVTACEYDDRPTMLKISGQWKQVTPKSLGKYADLCTTMAVTEEEAMQQAQTLLSLHGALIQNPSQPMIYPEAKQFALLADVMRLMGHESTGYIQDPMSEDKQPAIIQMQQQNQSLQQQTQQLTQQLQVASQQISQLQMQIINRQAEIAVKQGELDRKTDQEQQKIDIQRDAEMHDQIMNEMELGVEVVQDRGVQIG